jgi:hypothetical protein
MNNLSFRFEIQLQLTFSLSFPFLVEVVYEKLAVILIPQSYHWLFLKKLSNITSFHYQISSLVEIGSLTLISRDSKFNKIILFLAVLLIVLTCSYRFFKVLARKENVFFHPFEGFPLFHLDIPLEMRCYPTIFTYIIIFNCFYPFLSFNNLLFIVIFIPIVV